MKAQDPVTAVKASHKKRIYRDCAPVSVSLSRDMAGWLRRAAAKQQTSVSEIIRQALLPAFEGRHAK